MSYFNPDADAALQGWIGLDTWDSGHPFDQQRFFHFVRVLIASDWNRSEGDLIQGLRRAIKDAHPKMRDSALEEEVLHAVIRVMAVVNYLKAD